LSLGSETAAPAASNPYGGVAVENGSMDQE